jgi:glutamate dehydrogenase/leucine dehydrogenase
MDVLRSRTPHVFGRSAAAGGPGSSADATALGVYTAIEASVAEAGLSGVSGLRVLVQGLGAVGAKVADLAAEAGAKLIVADVDDARCAQAAERHVHLVGREVLGWTPEQVTARTRQIGDTLRGIYEDARVNGVTSVEAAERAALRTLAAGRTGSVWQVG